MSAEATRTGLDWAFREAQALVRQFDRERYYATLFAPAERRPFLFALYAFNIEIARIRDLVSDALPGEMRLQWWRDVIDSDNEAGAAAHPPALALMETIRQNRLPKKAFFNLIEARTYDLYDDPMPTWLDLEGYCGETASALIQLASIVLTRGADPQTAELAGHAGVAYGLTGLLRNLPWHGARGHLTVPVEELEKHGIAAADLIAQMRAKQDGPVLRACLAAMRARARGHLAETRRLIGAAKPETAPAFLPVALVEPSLALMERPDYEPLRQPVELADWRKLFIIWRQARRAMG